MGLVDGIPTGERPDNLTLCRLEKLQSLTNNSSADSND